MAANYCQAWLKLLIDKPAKFQHPMHLKHTIKEDEEDMAGKPRAGGSAFIQMGASEEVPTSARGSTQVKQCSSEMVPLLVPYNAILEEQVKQEFGMHVSPTKACGMDMLHYLDDKGQFRGKGKGGGKADKNKKGVSGGKNCSKADWINWHKTNVSDASNFSDVATSQAYDVAEQFHVPNVKTEKSGYGLGWLVEENTMKTGDDTPSYTFVTLSHPGSFDGMFSTFVLFPTFNIGMCICNNSLHPNPLFDPVYKFTALVCERQKKRQQEYNTIALGQRL